MATNLPLDVCEAISVAHTGVMAFNMPVPMPFKTRAILKVNDYALRLEAEQLHQHTAEHPVRILGSGLQGCSKN